MKNEAFNLTALTLLTSNCALRILADALIRDGAVTRRMEIAKAMEDIAGNLATAHDKLVPAADGLYSVLLDKQCECDALSRQIEQIISG